MEPRLPFTHVGVPREALDARHDPPERGPCQVAPLEGACRAPVHGDDYHPTEKYRPRRLGVLIPQPCVSTRAI